MKSLNVRDPFTLFVLGTGLLSLFLILFSDAGIGLAVILGAVITGTVLLAISLESIIYILLFVRPSLDIFGTFAVSLIPGLPSINIAGMIAIISIILSLGILVRSKHNTTEIPLFWPLVLFVLAHGVFSIGSIDLGVSINEIVRVTSFVIMYFAGYEIVKDRDDFFRLIWVIILSGLIPGGVAVYEMISGNGLYTNPGFENRIAGTFGHPNVLGYFLLIVLALMVYMFLEKKVRGSMTQLLFIVYGLILSTLLIATYTRGAWIGFALLIGGVSLIRWPRRTIVVSAVSVPIMIVASLGYIWLESNVFVGWPRFEQIPIIDRVAGLFDGDPSDSILWRQQIWADMYQEGWERPLTGFGTGTVEQVTEEVRGLGLGALEVHNDYIKFFVEMGFIGFFLFIFMIAAKLFTLISLTRNRKDLLGIAMIFIVLVVYLSSIWDNLMRQTAVMWIFFALLGAVIKYKTEISEAKE